MDKEVVEHVHNGILLSHNRNASESVPTMWMAIGLSGRVSHARKRSINIVY